INYRILGSKDKKLLYFLPRSCHCFSKGAVKGTKMRVPINNNSSFSSLTKRAQFSLNLIQTFRFRGERLQVLTTNALTTWPFFTIPLFTLSDFGFTFFTAATTTLPM